MDRIKSWTLVSLLLVALGVLTYLLLRTEPESKADAVDLLSPRESAAASSASADEATSPASLDSAPFVPKEEPAVPEAMWSVVALDESGAALVGAEVTVWPDDLRELYDRVANHALTKSRLRNAKPFAAGHTGQNGVLPIPRLPPSNLEIRARSKSLSAVLAVPRPTTGARVTVTLRRPREVRVRVVDQAGAPLAGLKVTPPALPRCAEQVVAWTDANGFASFSLGGDQVDFARGGEMVFLVERPDGVSEVGRGLLLDPPAVTDVTIVCESVSAVRVRVVDELGQPVEAPLRLLCRRTLPDGISRSIVEKDGGKSREFAFQGPEVTLAGFHEPGPVEFILREAGRLEVAQAHTLEASPAATEVVLQRGKMAPVVVLRLIDQTGQPVALTPFFVQLLDHADAAAAAESERTPTHIIPSRSPEALRLYQRQVRMVQTDADGLIALETLPECHLVLKLHPQLGAEQVTYLSRHELAMPESAIFVQTLSPLQSGQRLELGPILVPELPFLASGLVTDGAGQPLSFAMVEVTDGAPRDPRSRPTREERLRAEGALRRLVARTDAEGRFEIRGLDAPADPVLVASLGRLRGTPARVQWGDRDLRLEVAAPGAIAGRGIINIKGKTTFAHSAKSSDPLRAQEQEGGGWPPPQSDEEGRFTIEGLTPGPYTVTLFLDHDYRLLVVRDVLVRSGETTRDPRLDGVVLGQDISTADIKVVDPNGAPIASANITFALLRKGYKNPSNRSGYTSADGTSWIFRHKDEQVAVRVQKEGYLPLETGFVDFPFEVKLQTGTTLQATIPGLIDLAAKDKDHHGFALKLKPIPAAGEASAQVSLFKGSEKPSDPMSWIETDEESIAISGLAPGTYEVSIERSPFRGGIKTVSGGLHFLGGAKPQKMKSVALGTIVLTPGAPVHNERFVLPPEAAEALRKPEPTEDP